MKQSNIFLAIILVCSFFTSCTKEDKIEPIVIVQTPLVEYSYSPEEVRAEQEINFNAKFLTGSSVITSWNWSFGDAAESTSNKQNAVFTYAEEGTYTVTLTATDADDETMLVSKEITVLEALQGALEANVVWSFTTETEISNNNDGSSSPVIDNEGVVYYLESFAVADSKLIAVNDLGTSVTKKWQAELGYNLRNAPAIDLDGNIYIGAWHANGLRKIKATDGSQLWEAATNSGISNSTTAIDANGNTYFGTRSEGIQSWDTNGALRWAYNSPVSGARYYISPVLSEDGSTLYASITGGQFFAINTADGTLKWSNVVEFSGDTTGSSFSLDADGTVYFTTTEEVVAVTDNGTTGSVKWRYTTTGANSSGVVVDNSGKAYVGSASGLISLNVADGTENWTYDAIAVEESVPAIDSEGNIYSGTNDGRLVILNPLGELVKELNLTNGTVHSPTIADNGSVYVEAYGDTMITLFKIEVKTSEGPLNSYWPMKGKNRYNRAF